MIFHIAVKPGSRKDEFIIEANGSIKVKIREQPIEGKANKYLLKYLSGIFDVSKSKIELLKGENNPNKKISIDISDETVNSIMMKHKK